MLHLQCLVVLLCLCTAPLASAAPRFAHEASDLKPDPEVRFGTLYNGLRYVVRHNAEPKGRASLRLVVAAGSFHETEAQRGVAHFLEHMAFNGSTHYPAGTLISFFQRMGMDFGGDTNAFTSFDRTAYLLELPDTKPATLDEGFKVLTDYAGGMLLEPKEIDDERGIILSEKRTRDSVGYRTLLAEFDFALGGTRIPDRIPIGLESVIAKADRREFADFYDTWYRPELMAVVAVGDFDAAQVEKQIIAAFNPLTARAPSRSNPVLGTLPASNGLRVRFHAEPEAAATTVGLSSITPYQYEADTAAKRLAELPRSVALAMLNRRLSILAKQEGAPFSGARASVSESYDFYREASIEATCQPAQWSAALGVIEQELRRALDHGFQSVELREATANFQQSLEQAVRSAATRRSANLADEMMGGLIERTVFTTPEMERALFAPALAALTPEACTSALRDAWKHPGRNLFVTGNAKLEGEPTALLTAAYETSRLATVTAPVERKEAQFAYTNFGPAGKVVKCSEVTDLGITQLEFANGVRLNLKQTDFEANRVYVSVRIGTGQLTEPRDQPGLGTYAQSIFIPGGLGQHSADDLRQVLAGRTVGVGFGVGDDAFTLGGRTNRDDLLLQCQLIAAHLTDPGYRPEAMRQAKKAIEQFYTGLDHAIDGPFRREVPQLLASGDPRFGLPSREILLSRSVDEVKAWLTPQFTRGPIEIGIAGDLDLDATINAVAATLGALPARDSRAAHASARQVSFPAQALTKDYQIETKIPKGMVALYWPATDGNDSRISRRLQLLGSILEDRLRLKIREEIGGAYSPTAGTSLSDTYDGYGYLMARLTVEPSQATKIADAVQQIASDLATNGISEDELSRARLPLLTKLRESARTNGYWLGSVLTRAQEKPIVFDWARTRVSDNEAITKAELDALAKQYFGTARLARFISLPLVPPDTAAVAPAPATKPSGRRPVRKKATIVRRPVPVRP